MAAGTGRWSEAQIAGHQADIYEPVARNPYGNVILFLHGVHLGRLVNNAAFCAEFDRFGLPVVAPMTARSWWTDRICREFDPEITAESHILNNVVPWISEQFGSSPGQIALLGTSMGGQGALRFAFKYPAKFPIAAGISPAIDYQIRYYDEEGETVAEMYADPEAARQDTATLHVHPLNWPRHLWFCSDPIDYRWHESAQRLHMKLYSLGIPHEHDLETSAGGHSWSYYNTMAPQALKFIAECLDQERRRV